MERSALIAGAWAESGRYIDPLIAGDGHAGIGAMVAGMQKQPPGHRLRRASEVEARNGAVRFGWALAAQGRRR